MNLVDLLLMHGLRDILPLSEVVSEARRVGNRDMQIHDAVMSSIRAMIDNGWVAVGDAIIEGDLIAFRPWSLSATECAGRIRAEWRSTGWVRPGDVCWLQLTPAGRLAAENL